MTSDDARKLFVAGLMESVDENLLRSLFEDVGVTVVSVSLPRDRATGRSRGFGFVTLSTEDEAERARNLLDGSIQAGRAISVRRFHVEPPKRTEARPDATPNAGGGDSSTLYVGNLPYDVTQAELEALFVTNGFGAPSRLHMPASPDGRARGFGFVTLATAEVAQRAVQALHQSELKGRRLIVNLAHAKGDRPASVDRPVRRPRMSEASKEPSPARPSEPPRAAAPSFPGAFEESARPVEGRRARAGGEVKKKKKASKRRATAEEPRHERGARGGAGSWQKWTDWDED